MVNDLINGISIKLNQVFGYEIYSKNVEQGLEPPCFFIKALNPSRKQMIGNRYYLEVPFDVHYFPSVRGNNDELDEVGTSLFNDLEYINLLNGVPASNKYAKAKFPDSRSNNLKIIITIIEEEDDEEQYNVITTYNDDVVDSQIVLSASELIDNDYLTFVKTEVLKPTEGLPLSGGSDGDTLKGMKMNYEKIDGILHFFVTYGMFLKQDIPAEDPMEELNYNGGVG
jgi:hypothetical protein